MSSDTARERPTQESLDRAMKYLIEVYRFEGDNQLTLAQLLDERELAVRLEEAEWRCNHWPPLGALLTVESLQAWIAERGAENQLRVAALRQEGAK